jgi:hypothetical protein
MSKQQRSNGTPGKKPLRFIEPFADRSALSHLGRTSGIWGFISWELPLESIGSVEAVKKAA